MPFDIEYTNYIKAWMPPDEQPDGVGEEYILSIATELPIYFVLPEGIRSYDYKVRTGISTETVTIYQDCVKHYYGDHFAPDHRLRYRLLRLSEIEGKFDKNFETGRKYIEKMRSVVKYITPVKIENKDRFTLHQLRPFCVKLMDICNKILDAERATFHRMAGDYPLSISFFSTPIYWCSLYQNEERRESFPFMGSTQLLALNPPFPVTPEDFPNVTTAVSGEDAYPDWWISYCKAATLFGQHNYRESVLEAIIGLEMGLSSYVRKKWRERGVSQSAIDRAKNDMTLSVMSNIELIALSDVDKRPPPELANKLNKSRKLRNEIVHEKLLWVSYEDAKVCLDAVKDALIHICPDIYDGTLMDRILDAERQRRESSSISEGAT